MKISKHLLTLLVLVTLFTESINAQQNSLQNRVDAYMKSYVQNGDFSGNILMIKEGKVIYSNSFGKANYELNVPMRNDIKFRIASLSKTFTAAAIVLLNKQGKLKYDDKLKKYIPGFIQGDSLTIQHLLLHQSGVADLNYDQYALDRLSLRQIIDTIKARPFYFKPGSQSRYSNSGYLLLAAVIETVSGKTYEQYLSENIFKKLGMNATGVDYPENIIQNKATGYSVGTGVNGIAAASWYDINLETGSGSLYSTTGDLVKWLEAIKSKTLFDITQLLYPFGWGPREYFKNRKSIEQSGFLNGYSSYMALYSSDNLAIVALSNISSNFNEQSGKDLAAIYFGEKYTLPERRVKNQFNTNLSRLTGKYSWPGYKDFFIEQRGDAIYWRFGDEKTGSPLALIGKDIFLLRLTNNKIIFKQDDNHKISGLSFFMGENETFCKKVID